MFLQLTIHLGKQSFLFDQLISLAVDGQTTEVTFECFASGRYKFMLPAIKYDYDYFLTDIMMNWSLHFS